MFVFLQKMVGYVLLSTPFLGLSLLDSGLYFSIQSEEKYCISSNKTCEYLFHIAFKFKFY